MEPPFKRQRLAPSSYPEIDLHARRAQNDFRLKSIFESIFDKYGRNFDGIGDEIDIETGEIVVNNGHILGMTNERDAGAAESSPEELGNSDNEDYLSSLQYSEEYLAAVASKAEDPAVIEESEASEQSDLDADSLMGDVPAESHLQKLGKKSRRVVSIPSDDEEDELASSDIEWASHSKDRLGAQERWCLLKEKAAFADEPAIEPAWRAPPLPNVALLKREREKVRPITVDKMRDYSDDERAGISLWASEIKKHRRRRHKSANSVRCRSVSSVGGQENFSDGVPSDLSNSEPVARRIIKWTEEEEELLIHLKTTTNLSGAAMKSYFPERQSSSIGSHWTYMIANGKAPPKPRLPTALGHEKPLPSLSSGTTSLAPNETRLEPYNHEIFSKAKKMQIVQQQSYGGFPEAGGLVRSSSKPTELFGNDMSHQSQVGRDHAMTNGLTMDAPILINDDVGAHIGSAMEASFLSSSDCGKPEDVTADKSLDASEPFARASDRYHPLGKVHNRSVQSFRYRHHRETRRTKSLDKPKASARRTFGTALDMDGNCNAAEVAESASQANSNESDAYTDESYGFPKSLENENEEITRREMSAPNLPKQEIEVAFENGYGPRASSPTMSIKAELQSGDAEPFDDGIVSPELQHDYTTANKSSNLPKQFGTSHSILHQEESIPPTAEDVDEKKRSTAEGPEKFVSTALLSTTSAKPPNHGTSNAPYKPNVEKISKTAIERQIVQVVIPMAATSDVVRQRADINQSPSNKPHTRSPLATTETEDSAFVEQPSSTALGPGLPHQEVLVIRTPTRSPSVAAAESQYAASAALVLGEIRSSLGREIADSQPLSTTPVIATPAPEIGAEATKPIILDDDSQILCVTSSAAPSAQKEPKEATTTIVLASDSQPLRVTSEIAAPARKRIEEATESDVVESGSHPLRRTLLAARIPSEKIKKEIAAESLCSRWTAIDDCSEDELSYL